MADINDDFPCVIASSPEEERTMSIRGYVYEDMIKLVAEDEDIYDLFLSCARHVASLCSENGSVDTAILWQFTCNDDSWEKFLDVFRQYNNHQKVDEEDHNIDLIRFAVHSYVNTLACMEIVYDIDVVSYNPMEGCFSSASSEVLM